MKGGRRKRVGRTRRGGIRSSSERTRERDGCREEGKGERGGESSEREHTEGTRGTAVLGNPSLAVYASSVAGAPG